MFMIAMPPAIEVWTVGISVHVSPVPPAGNMDLTVLVISVPATIQMPAVRIAMHMSVMMAMPVVSVDVDVLRCMYYRIGSRCSGQWTGGQTLCCRQR